MLPIEISPKLLLALNWKFTVDMHLLRLQQDMSNGKQVFSASAVLSALEDCDDAIAAVWLELGQTLRNGDTAEAQTDSRPNPIDERVPAQTSAMLAATQQLVRRFFTKTSKAASPLQPSE